MFDVSYTVIICMNKNSVSTIIVPGPREWSITDKVSWLAMHFLKLFSFLVAFLQQNTYLNIV